MCVCVCVITNYMLVNEFHIEYEYVCVYVRGCGLMQTYCNNTENAKICTSQQYLIDQVGNVKSLLLLIHLARIFFLIISGTIIWLNFQILKFICVFRYALTKLCELTSTLFQHNPNS